MTAQMPAERVAPRKNVLPPLPPTIPSGRAVLGGQCPHVPPDECDDCNGVRADEAELRRDRRRAETTRRRTT